MKVAADRLRSLVVDTLVGAGSPEAPAAVVANHLMLADSSGVRTHGVIQLPQYLEQIEAGELLPDVLPRVARSDPPRELIDGGRGFGQVAAEHAVDRGIALAADAGLALVGLVRANHIGRLGHYVERACAADMACLVWGGGYGAITPRAVPFGGRDAALDTNPLAIGVPLGDRPPLVVDFATTALSGVKVKQAEVRGESLPPWSIVDTDGVPSTDPADFAAGGAYLPFGGEHGAHKGYGLMLAAELLGRALAGADAFAAEGAAPTLMRHQGVTFWLTRADSFGAPSAGAGVGAFASHAETIVARVLASAPAPGHERVQYPGLPEAEAREAAKDEGVPVDDRVWDGLVAAGERLGVEWSGVDDLAL